MNSVVSKPSLIGIDWGTSSLRAFQIGMDGDVLDSVSTPQGISYVKDRDFDAAFHELVGPWLAQMDLPVVASGMITSRNGWVETPYAQVPAGGSSLARALVKFKTSSGQTVHFVTGMTTEHDGAPDVMRGEEAQIIGALAMGMDAGIYVMPGTHSKWITVSETKIEDYATYMTGEIYAALRGHTILGTFIQDGPFCEDGFRRGVASGLAAGQGLLHTLFHVRTMPLFGKIRESMNADFLSGILIGSEISAATEALEPGVSVTIVGRNDLADRYEIALEIADFECNRAPENIVARGHFEIAKSAGLLS